MHHHLALALAERVGEVVAVVAVEDVGEPGLAAVLVYALGDLVARGVAEPGEEGEELAAEGRGRVLLEDDLGERRGGRLYVGDAEGIGTA